MVHHYKPKCHVGKKKEKELLKMGSCVEYQGLINDLIILLQTLFDIISPANSANKMGMDTDSNNRGCFAMQGDKPCLSFYGLMLMVTTNVSAIWLTGYEI